MASSKTVFVLAVTIFFMLACDSSSLPSRTRVERADAAKGDIVIGIVGTSVDPNLFYEGVDMAVEEINQREGVLGRRIKTINYDDKGSASEGQKVARRLSGNPDVVAVVGHFFSDVAIPASITYNQQGILFISPGATDPFLTQSGNFTFRNIPNDNATGRQAAELVSEAGYKNIAIVYQRNSVNKRLSEIFHEHAVTKGIEIVATRSFFPWQTDFRSVLSELKQDYKFDCIFLAGTTPAAANLIKQAREMGITVPFIGGDGLDSPSLLTIAGRAAEGTTVATAYNPSLSGIQSANFVKQFHAKYGFTPDSWAAQGYDAISVLAAAIEKANSTVPIVLSTTLKFMGAWNGVTGSYAFTPTGDITGKPMFFKTVQNGKFVFHRTDEKKEINLFEYVEDFTLRLPLEKAVASIDPGFSRDNESIEVAEQLFLGLTDLDPKTYAGVPALALHWESDPEGKTYTFHLRKDAKWTNGETITAHDVVWAIRRNIKPETKAPLAAMLYIVKNAEAIHKGKIQDISKLGVRARDNFTVVFELEHAAAYFPALAGLGVYRPLPQKTIEKHQGQWTDPDKIQTSGSYKVASWEKGMGMVLIKNPFYYDAQNVAIPEVRYFVIPQSSIGLAMYENNELDIMGSGYTQIPLEEIHRVQASPKLENEYSSKQLFCTYSYTFNSGLTPVDNPLVRRAISAVIDRQMIIDVLTGGEKNIATTFTTPLFLGVQDARENEGIRFNPEKARQWLTEAGYPDGKNFPLIVLSHPISERHLRFARAIKASLSHYLNINVILRSEKFDVFLHTTHAADPPHMFMSYWCADYPDATSFLNVVFNPAKPLFKIAWNNTEFNALLKKAQTELNPQVRNALFRRAEYILCEKEAIVVPIFFDQTDSLVKPRIRGWYHMAIGGQHIRNWHFRE